MVDEIDNFKDLKDALNKVPDEILVHFTIGASEDDVGVVDLDWNDDWDIAQEHFNQAHKFSEFIKILEFFELCRAAFRDEDYDDAVSTRDFDKTSGLKR